VAVATKQAGRVLDILVGEGDFVTAGQPVARMQIDSLQAQRDEAMARLQQAQLAVSSAQVQVAQRESDLPVGPGGGGAARQRPRHRQAAPAAL
jgi:HlyD family secretion protein